MAVTFDCSPCWNGRPDYDPNDGTALLTTTSVTRSRSGGVGGAVINLTVDSTQITVDSTQFTADQTFFKIVSIYARSKLVYGGESDVQGQICNSIALQIISVDNTVPPNGIIDQYDLVVFFFGVEVERYVTTLQPENCGDLILPDGGLVSDGGAIADLRTQVNASSDYISMPIRGTDVNDNGADPICLADEGPTFLAGAAGPLEAQLAAVRTGPQRSFLFTSSKENALGVLVFPGSDRMTQWDFDIEFWVPYAPNADCRPEGTDC